MKFTHRVRRRLRGALANNEVTPTRPPDALTVTYCGILDGESLWLAVDGATGSVALREQASGELTELESDLPDDTSGTLSVRAPLSAVGGEGSATYDVVLVSADRTTLPLWVAPFADQPVVTPPTRDGRTQFGLRRGADGTLKISRRALAPSAELRSIASVEEGVELAIGHVDAELATNGSLLLVSGEADVRASYPLVVEGDVVRAVVSIDGLPSEGDRFARFAVGSPERWLHVRRRANGVADANEAVVLPELAGEDPEDPLVRFRWNDHHHLAVRLLYLEAAEPAVEAGASA